MPKDFTNTLRRPVESGLAIAPPSLGARWETMR
jgi:hypothetical protein